MEQNLKQLKQNMISRRQELFERYQQLNKEQQQLNGREIEYEEEAQKATLSEVLSQLDAWEKQELEELDLALNKLDKGTYGYCEACEQPISIKRLKAFPEARYCQPCATRMEQQRSEQA